MTTLICVAWGLYFAWGLGPHWQALRLHLWAKSMVPVLIEKVSKHE